MFLNRPDAAAELYSVESHMDADLRPGRYGIARKHAVTLIIAAQRSFSRRGKTVRVDANCGELAEDSAAWVADYLATLGYAVLSIMGGEVEHDGYHVHTITAFHGNDECRVDISWPVYTGE